VAEKKVSTDSVRSREGDRVEAKSREAKLKANIFRMELFGATLES